MGWHDEWFKSKSDLKLDSEVSSPITPYDLTDTEYEQIDKVFMRELIKTSIDSSNAKTQEDILILGLEIKALAQVRKTFKMLHNARKRGTNNGRTKSN